MQLTCIGTGTAVPEPDRVCSGFLLETGDLRLLLDCGPGVVHGMARLGVDWKRITHVCLSHFHNDHIGDLPMLFFAWRHGMRPARAAPLVVIGPGGTRRMLAAMGSLFGSHISDPSFPVDVHEVGDRDELKLSDVAQLRTRRTPHTETSVAYRVEAAGRSFCYTGDTGPSDEIAVFAQSSDALLIECSLPDDEPMAAHLTPQQLAAMARTALPRRLLVTHVYPQLSRQQLPLLVREGGWPAEVHVVADGDVIDI